MWEQKAACEVEGPSVHPSTQQGYTHLVSPMFILNGSISARISSLNTDALPSDLGVIASGSWVVMLATITVAAHL